MEIIDMVDMRADKVRVNVIGNGWLVTINRWIITYSIIHAKRNSRRSRRHGWRVMSMHN